MSANKHNQVTTFMWLVRREYWQNRGLFVWAPIAIGAVFFTMFLFVEFVSKDIIGSEHRVWMQKTFGEAESKQMILRSTGIVVADMSRFILQVMLLISGLLSSLYLFGALNNERRDRSILFWKSMPVSDTQEVLSKLIFPLLLSPLITLIIAFLSYIIAAVIVAFVSLITPYDLFSVILFNKSLYQVPLQYLCLMPFYAVWSLPCVAWFLLVSGWTKSKVFPWAIGMPILVAIVVGFIGFSIGQVTNSELFIRSVIARVTVGNLPGAWILQMPTEKMRNLDVKILDGLFSPEVMNKSAWYCVQDYSLLIGLIVGIALTALAIRRRRFSDVMA